MRENVERENSIASSEKVDQLQHSNKKFKKENPPNSSIEQLHDESMVDSPSFVPATHSPGSNSAHFPRLNCSYKDCL